MWVSEPDDGLLNMRGSLSNVIGGLVRALGLCCGTCARDGVTSWVCYFRDHGHGGERHRRADGVIRCAHLTIRSALLVMATHPLNVNDLLAEVGDRARRQGQGARDDSGIRSSRYRPPREPVRVRARRRGRPRRRPRHRWRSAGNPADREPSGCCRHQLGGLFLVLSCLDPDASLCVCSAKTYAAFRTPSNCASISSLNSSRNEWVRFQL